MHFFIRHFCFQCCQVYMLHANHFTDAKRDFQEQIKTWRSEGILFLLTELCCWFQKVELAMSNLIQINFSLNSSEESRTLMEVSVQIKLRNPNERCQNERLEGLQIKVKAV